MIRSLPVCIDCVYCKGEFSAHADIEVSVCPEHFMFSNVERKVNLNIIVKKEEIVITNELVGIMKLEDLRYECPWCGKTQLIGMIEFACRKCGKGFRA